MPSDPPFQGDAASGHVVWVERKGGKGRIKSDSTIGLARIIVGLHSDLVSVSSSGC